MNAEKFTPNQINPDQDPDLLEFQNLPIPQKGQPYISFFYFLTISYMSSWT